MSAKEIIISIIILLFAAIGGAIDTYASHRFFPPKIHPPRWLSDIFLFWWLVIFVGVFPFLLVFVALDYNPEIIKVFVTFWVLGSVIWDLVFSKIWSGKWISDSCVTWFWLGKHNLGFTEKTILPFHVMRLVLFLFLFYFFFLNE